MVSPVIAAAAAIAAEEEAVNLAVLP